MILVAGATGFLGGEICRQLVAKNHQVAGIVRPTSDPNRVEHLKALGVDLVEADFKDKGSLDHACQGIDIVISTVTTTLSRQPGDTIESVDHGGQLSLVEAAESAGVRHFIFISYAELDDDDPCPLTIAKRAVERRLKHGRMLYTILRPTYFMDIWLGPALGFDLGNGQVTVNGAGDNKISWIALPDVAQFAVEAVDNPAARNATIKLGGPDAITPNEVIAMAERLSGRRFEVQHISEGELEAQRAAATDSLSKSFGALRLAACREHRIPMEEIRRQFPLRLGTVEEHVKRAAGSPVYA
jgi:uncharacterized protein YbjT (DUF2867 family)